MATEPKDASTSATVPPIFRLNIQAVSRGVDAVARVQAAAVKVFADDLLQVECFVVRDDAHPANKPK